MDPDVIAVRGDGVGTAFIRDGSGAARVTIHADCRTLQETVLERPTFTITTTRVLQSVRVELAGQGVPATRTSSGDGTGTFSASIDVSGTAGVLTGRVVAAGRETQRRTLVSPPGTTTTTHDWTSEASFTTTVVADTTPPTIQLVSLDGQTNAEAGQTMRLDVTDTESGLRSATWEIVGSGGGNLEPDGGGFRAAVDWRIATGSPRSAPAPADLPVRIRARDKAMPNGNEATLAHTLHDSVAPTLQIDTPADDAELIGDGTGASVTFSGSVSDHWSGVASLTLSVDDAPAVDLRPGQPTVTETAWSHALRIPDFGRHRVLVRARDAAGNETVQTRTVIVVDITPPVIQLVSLDGQTNAEAGQTMRLDVTDTGSGLRSATWEIVGSGGGNLEPDGGGFRAAVDWRIATGSPRSAPAPADLPVRIRARDKAMPNGNEATLAHTLHDSVAPTLQIDTPADDAELIGDGTGASVTFSGSVSDHWSGVASLTLSVDDAPAVDLRPGQPTVTETAWSHALRIPDFGRHRVLVRARDAAGNETVQTRTVSSQLIGPGQWLDVGAPSTGVVEVLGLLDLWNHPTLSGLHLAVRGADNHLWTAGFDGQGWRWTDHHAGLAPTASPVVARGMGAVVVNSAGPVPFMAVQSTVGRLWIRWNSGAAWQWTDRGRPPGVSVAAPVGIGATVTDDGPTVVVQGSNGQLWFQKWVANWVGLTSPAGRQLGPTLVGVTTVGSPLGERLVAVVGSDDGHAWSVVPGSAAWTDLGAPAAGVTVSGPVGTVRSGEGSFRGFVTGSDGHLWVVDVDGSAVRWTDLGQPPGAGIAAPVGVRPALSAVSRSLAYVIGTDDRLRVVGWDGTARDWQDRGAPTTPVAVGSAPTATVAAVRLGSGMPLHHIALTCTPDGHAWLHRVV